MDQRKSAVVLGGSIAGLLAARKLADHFERVTVVERDRLPGEPAPRKGVPQARHLHGLLMRGAETIERQLPGFGAALDRAGAPILQIGDDVAVLSPFGWLHRFPQPLPLRAATRDLVEAVIRRRVRMVPRITFLEERGVVGLVHERGRVTGARVVERNGGAECVLSADLVIDATGRGSQAPQWLRSLGLAEPEETVVDAFVGTASRLYAGVPPLRGGHAAIFLMSKPPDAKRRGSLFPVENGLFIVGLAGAGGDYPPAEEEDFLEFARSLRSTHIYEAIRDAKPASPIVTSRSTANRLHHYERMVDWPAGFIVLGDAVCAFNPIYGQGMTVAALEAESLGEMLGAGDFVTRAFQRRLWRDIARVWAMATLEDFRFETTAGRRPIAARVVHRYMDALFALAPRDPLVSRHLSTVLQLLAPSTSLLAPALVSRLIRAWWTPDSAVAAMAALGRGA